MKSCLVLVMLVMLLAASLPGVEAAFAQCSVDKIVVAAPNPDGYRQWRLFTDVNYSFVLGGTEPFPQTFVAPVDAAFEDWDFVACTISVTKSVSSSNQVVARLTGWFLSDSITATTFTNPTPDGYETDFTTYYNFDTFPVNDWVAGPGNVPINKLSVRQSHRQWAPRLRQLPALPIRRPRQLW